MGKMVEVSSAQEKNTEISAYKNLPQTKYYFTAAKEMS